MREWHDFIVAHHFIPQMDYQDFSETFAWHIEMLPPNRFEQMVNVWGTQFSVGRYLLELYVFQTDTATVNLELGNVA